MQLIQKTDKQNCESVIFIMIIWKRKLNFCHMEQACL